MDGDTVTDAVEEVYRAGTALTFYNNEQAESTEMDCVQDEFMLCLFHGSLAKQMRKYE